MTSPLSHTRPTLLHEFFEASAMRVPDLTAVDVPPGLGRPQRAAVTYRQLRSSVHAVAARLGGRVRPDEVVAILLPRDSHWIYAAQLAVLEVGGAFTCIDTSFPDEHVRAVLADSAAAVLLTDDAGLARLGSAGISVEYPLDVRSVEGKDEFVSSPASLSGRNLAYVIYTSGTTGAPKGVMIEHHSVVNLVASDLDEFRLAPGDRIAQGSSGAYDSSIEEIWLAFAAGATLVVMDDQTSRLGPDLVPWLRRERISVFCPPPTVLRTTGCLDPAAALPDLRLLYVGGEALTEDLASRWARGRRLVNGYGPTECTVTVVRGDIHPDRPVTIGRPVQGHTAFVLDADLVPVADGADGELCIAGPGLARGYHNRPDTTESKFPVHPRLGRIYRTGDLVRRNAEGDLEYLGRIDAQVKLRGYRIELEAIETHLSRCPGVREAACRVQGADGAGVLAACIVPVDAAAPPEFEMLRAALRRALPVYMVPSRFGLTETLPRTVGGKLDRKALPEIPADQGEPRPNHVAPVDPVELLIACAFASALRLDSPVSANDDFFTDLGGDSLSAVGVVCELRKHPRTANITTRDIYQARTPARLAHTAGSRPARCGVGRPADAPSPTDKPSPVLVTVLQSMWLIGSLVVIAAVGYAGVFELLPRLLAGLGVVPTLLLTPVLAILATLAYTLLTVAATVVVKRIVIGRYRPTVTPVWSEYYFRCWIVEQTARLIPWSLLAGTTAYGAVLRMLGAKVGRRVHIHHGVNLQQGGWDLLTLGDDVSLGCDSWLGLMELDSGCLRIAPVTIGPGATLEVRAGVSGQAELGPGAVLTALSWLPSGGRVPAAERWDGVPAEYAGAALSPPPAEGVVLSPGVHGVLLIGSLLLRRGCEWIPGLLVLCGIAGYLGVTPAAVAAWIEAPTWSNGLLPVMLAAPVLWVPVSLVIRALGVRAMGRVTPGIINRWSPAYIRVWHKVREVDSAGRWLSGTLFWPVWLRLAGMKVGRDCEISTIIDVIPECVRVGPGCFFADGIYLGGPKVHSGSVTIGATSLAGDTFLGNHVVIPTGAELPEAYFLGVCTVADQPDPAPGTSWFGHPAIQLPRRNVVEADRHVTHDPEPARYANRVFWEGLRFALPVVPILIFYGWLSAMSLAAGEFSEASLALLIAPALTFAALAAECLFVLILKWLLLGRAHEGRHPLWSCWCSRWDFLYVAWQFCSLAPLTALQGTLLLNAFLRATGARIGRRVVLGPGFAQLVDPDMLNIEDGATVNAAFQAHTFEDRVLKLAPVHVRENATIGENTVVFYGADIGAGSWVAPNGVVMKNEQLTPGLEFAGCPVQSQDATAGDSPPTVRWPDAEPPAVRAVARLEPLDVARGFAVLGMIFMHFVPAGESLAEAQSPLSLMAGILEGKSAALFCVLAGITWSMQARRTRWSAQTRWYMVRRALSLAAIGLILHIFAWPTEVLLPLSCMMIISACMWRAGRTAVAASAIVALACAPIVSQRFGAWFASDWAEDGSHLADKSFGWSWVRYLVLDGNYPLVPWLAFPLIGMLIAWRGFEQVRSVKRCFVAAITIAAISQGYAFWAGANAAKLGEYQSCLATSWVPTTLPFVLLTASSAVALIAGLMWWRLAHGPGWLLRPIALIGRASLTHYLLHILLVYAPLRWFLGHEEWSAETGLTAFLGYLLFAAPATILWFRGNPRGPVEGLWAWASGTPDRGK